MNVHLDFKLKKLNYAKKIMLAFAVFIAFIAVLFIMIDIPAIKNIQKTSDEIDFQRLDLEKKYFKSQRTKNINMSLSKIESEMSKLDNVFINENRELEFVTRLESVAAKNGVGLEISLDKDNRGEELANRTLELYLRLNGTYENLTNYLADLEALEYYIDVTDIEFASQGENSYVMAVKALTYWNLF